jgi:hypothetical protein
VALHPGHKARLTARTAARFSSGSLFDKVARALCAVGTVPRKELYEAWEVARRARRRFRGGRVVDLACGHGLAGQLALLLDDSSPGVVGVDTRIPKSAPAVRDALAECWPRLRGRVELSEGDLANTAIAATDLVLSCHGCGALTDRVLDAAIAAGARVAVLPCCQERGRCDPGRLEGWLPFDVAVDVVRAQRLEQAGFSVWTQAIDRRITPKNRLLIAAPPSVAR